MMHVPDQRTLGFQAPLVGLAELIQGIRMSVLRHLHV